MKDARSLFYMQHRLLTPVAQVRANEQAGEQKNVCCQRRKEGLQIAGILKTIEQ